MLMSQPCRLQIIFGLFEIDLGNSVDLVSRLGAAALALSGHQCDPGEIDILAVIQRLLSGFNALPVQFHTETVERGLFLLQLVLQFGTIQNGQGLTLTNFCARIHAQANGACGRSKQSWADGGHNPPLD